MQLWMNSRTVDRCAEDDKVCGHWASLRGHRGGHRGRAGHGGGSGLKRGLQRRGGGD